MQTNKAYGHGQTLHLDNAALMHAAPSIFAEGAAKHTSNKFVYVPTIQVIEEMRVHGWLPTLAKQVNTRIEKNEGYQKHMVRFRRQEEIERDAVINDHVTELVLLNAHNGSSSYQIHAGMYRYVCANGMVVSDACIDSVKVRHSGDVVNEIIEGTYSIMKETPALSNTIEAWRNLELNRDQREAFGQAAITLRCGENTDTVEYRPDLIIQPKRRADQETNLWNTFNVVQEKVINGGVFSMRKAKYGQQRRKVKAINSVHENVKLNKALWVLAESMQKIMG